MWFVIDIPRQRTRWGINTWDYRKLKDNCASEWIQMLSTFRWKSSWLLTHSHNQHFNMKFLARTESWLLINLHFHQVNEKGQGSQTYSCVHSSRQWWNLWYVTGESLFHPRHCRTINMIWSKIIITDVFSGRRAILTYHPSNELLALCSMPSGMDYGPFYKKNLSNQNLRETTMNVIDAFEEFATKKRRKYFAAATREEKKHGKNVWALLIELII